MPTPKKTRKPASTPRTGRPKDPRLAPKRDTVSIRPHVGERLEWERAARHEDMTLHGWIRKLANDRAAAVLGKP